MATSHYYSHRYVAPTFRTRLKQIWRMFLALMGVGGVGLLFIIPIALWLTGASLIIYILYRIALMLT